MHANKLLLLIALAVLGANAYVPPTEIRIGQLFSNLSTGVDAMLGNAKDMGTTAKLAVEKLNADNFIPGVTFTLVQADIKAYQPDLSVYGTLDFIQNHNIHCLVGPQQIAPTRVTAGISGALKVPQLGFATDDEMASRALYPTYYRMQPSSTYNYLNVLRLMAYLHFDRIAIIDSNTALYPSSFFAEAARLNITIVAYVTITPVGATYPTMPTIIETLKNSRARVFHSAAANANDANALLAAAYAAGLDAPENVWFGNRVEVSYAQAQRKFAGLLSVVFGVTLGTPKYLEFYQVYNASYDDLANYPHAAARTSASAGPINVMTWDAIFTYATVAKNLIEAELNLNSTNFVNQMNTISFTGGSGPVSFTSAGERNMPLHLKVVRRTPSGNYGYDVNAEVSSTASTISFVPFLAFKWASNETFNFPVNTSSLANAAPIAGVPAAFSCLTPCDHGICVAQDTCQCFDTDLWSGKLCDKKKYIEWSDPAGQAILGIAIAFSILTLIVFIILLIHRTTPAVRKSSSTFCLLMTLGFLLGYLSMLTYIGKPTPTLCRAQFWVPTMAFALVFANLLAKTWRINLIFNNTSVKILPVRDTDLLRFSLGLVLLDSIILIVWSAGFPPEAVNTLLSGGDEHYVLTCGSVDDGQSQTILMAVLLAFNLLLVVVAAVLAYRTRKVNYSYRESRFIGYAVYNILFCSVVFLALILSLENGSSISFALKQLVTWLMVTFTLAVLLVPKVWMVLKYTPEQQSELFESKERKHGYSGSNNKHSSQDQQSSKVTGVQGTVGSPVMSRHSTTHDNSVTIEMTKKSSDKSSEDSSPAQS